MSSPFLFVFGDDRVTYHKEQMIFQVMLLMHSDEERLAWDSWLGILIMFCFKLVVY